MNQKAAIKLVVVLTIIHFGINLLLSEPYRIKEIILLSFYFTCYFLGFLINYSSKWLSDNSKIQVGQAFMVFSFLKLVILAIGMVILIRNYQMHKLSTIVHFMFPYYFATGLAVNRLLKQLGSQAKKEY